MLDKLVNLISGCFFFINFPVNLVYMGKTKYKQMQLKLNGLCAIYLISHNNATPLNVQCRGLKSVSKSIEPTYF